MVEDKIILVLKQKKNFQDKNFCTQLKCHFPSFSQEKYEYFIQDKSLCLEKNVLSETILISFLDKNNLVQTEVGGTFFAWIIVDNDKSN